jgi:hypothetical protein
VWLSSHGGSSNYDLVLLERLAFDRPGLASTDWVEVRGHNIVPRDLLEVLVTPLPQSDALPDDHEVLRMVVIGNVTGPSGE